MKTRIKIISVLQVVFFVIFSAVSAQKKGDKVFAYSYDELERVKQILVAPPAVPIHEFKAGDKPKIIEVELIADERKIEVAPEDSVWAMTFNGTVPSPVIVAHEGDYVEVTIKNLSSNALRHNVDFHAATGHHGGGALSEVKPGEIASFSFKATKAGAFIYHCAPGGMMTPIHVVSGMNGVILVLPREGLKDQNGNTVLYDKAFYIVEQDYYLPKDENGKIKDFDNLREGMREMMESINSLQPTHIVFNGAEDSLNGENSLQASVGENVLFIFGQANRDTRLHIIGGHADLFWPFGKFNNKPYVDLETWDIPAGSAAVALYKFVMPGQYTLLNHNLIEAIVFGANATINVEGEENIDLMKVISEPALY